MKTIKHAMLIVVLITLSTFQSWAADEPTYTKKELVKMSAASSSAKPEEIEAVMTLTQEATVFFNLMACENALPSTPNKILKRLEAKIDPPGYAIKYPVKVIIDIELKEPASGLQQYTMEKSAVNKHWKILSASQMGADNKKMTDLKMPTQADQKKANDKVSESVKEWNDQK